MKLTITKLAEKAAEKINKNNTRELAQILFCELQKQKKIGQLERLLEEIEQKVSEKDGSLLATVSSVKELSAEEKEQLKSHLEKRTGSKIVIKNVIESKIIGAIKIKIKDEIVDFSFRGILDQINLKMAGPGSRNLINARDRI